MAYTASKLVELAKAEVGYLEKRTNSNLDSKTGNAGYNNYTKYARDLFKADYYNGNKNGYAWCDCFVDWLFYMLCGKNAKKAQDMICQTGELGASCVYSARYYRNAGRFHTTPKVGDQIFFGSKGNESHTGIVYAVDASTVYTIEGNTSSAAGVVANGGGVFKKSYARNYSRIVGYGRPKYDAEPAATTKPTEKKNLVQQFQEAAIADGVSCGAAGADGIWGLNTAKAAQNLLKTGSKGNRVKLLQQLIGATADGIFGVKTHAAVRAYQSKKGLAVDGVVGLNTWKVLLNV